MTGLVYVVRHCRAEGQAPESRLTAEGREMAERLATVLVARAERDGQRIERIVASPFVRARESIAPLAEQLGLAVETDERLRERVLAGSARADWLERLRESFEDMDLCLEGGESSRAAMARAAVVLDDVRRPAVGSAGTTVLVTHGNLMALLLRHVDGRFGFGEWRGLTNPDVYRVAFAGRDGQVSAGRAGVGVERVWTG